MDISKYKEIYLSECEDNLQIITKNLLLLEKKLDNKDILNELMRASHTIKGSSATMTFTEISKLTHVMEDVFDYARYGYIKLNTTITDTLFDALDILEVCLESIKKNNKEISLKNITNKIKKITGVKTSGDGQSLRDKKGKPIINTAKSNLTLTKSNNITDYDSSANTAIDNQNTISYIKMATNKLDNLMDITEELIIDKMKLKQLKTQDKEIINIFSRLQKNIDTLQAQVTDMRLIPIDQILSRFPRIVRDLAHKQHKNIEFEIVGAETELDRSIVDKLNEPLMHMLRNAIDHGIKLNGKIKLIVQRDKDNVIIILEDNGQGINFEKIKTMAVKKMILSKKIVDSYSEEELKKLLFNPKMSTSERITETSGRGVGLSVIKEFVEKVNGNVEISTPDNGIGTKIVLNLPLTMAIIKVLIVRVDNSKYAIPFSIIDKSVLLEESQIKTISEQKVAIIEGTDISIIDLKSEFNLNSKNTNTNDSNKSIKTNIVIVKHSKEKIALLVDELLAEQDIIIKSLPTAIKDIKNYAGTTILGDGSVIMVIDINSLVDSYIKNERKKDKIDG